MSSFKTPNVCLETWENEWKQPRDAVDTSLPQFSFIANALESLPEQSHVADVGGGTGYIIAAIEKILKKSFNIFVVEPVSTPMVNFRYQLLKTSAETMATHFVDKKLDGVLASFILSYGDKEKIVSEIFESLRPGGIAVFLCHHQGSTLKTESEQHLHLFNELEFYLKFSLEFIKKHGDKLEPDAFMNSFANAQNQYATTRNPLLTLSLAKIYKEIYNLVVDKTQSISDRIQELTKHLQMADRAKKGRECFLQIHSNMFPDVESIRRMLTNHGFEIIQEPEGFETDGAGFLPLEDSLFTPFASSVSSTSQFYGVVVKKPE